MEPESERVFAGERRRADRRLRAFLLALGLAMLVGLGLAVSPAGAAQVRVREGQRVRLKLRNVLTTENVQKDDWIDFDVVDDVVVLNRLVVARGSTAKGKIVKVKGAGKRKAKDASVTFEFVSVRAVDNQEIPIRAVLTKSKKRESMEVEEDSPIPGYTERVVGAEKGKEYSAFVDATIMVNAPDTTPAMVGAPAPITPAQTAPQPAAATAPVRASALTLAPEPAAVEFSSTPTGADILIDGNFVGNTPSTLRVTPGRHTVEVRLSGYHAWTRTMVVDPDSHPTVRATLVRE
ncbi:MAG: PEGA domain-containing protein [Acidobacteriia bacterium]|nr:PEGA domain-containing protein [Terriglobia bacterium]